MFLVTLFCIIALFLRCICNFLLKLTDGSWDILAVMRVEDCLSRETIALYV